MNFMTNGEIVSLQQADQFQPGHSAYECGFFGVMMARSMAPVGQNPTLSSQQIVNQIAQLQQQLTALQKQLAQPDAVGAVKISPVG